VRLVRRQVVEAADHRPKELDQPRESNLRLGFEARGTEDEEAVRSLDRVGKQRALAYAGLTPDQERTTPLGAGAVEQLVEQFALGLTPDEEGRPPATDAHAEIRTCGASGAPGRKN